MSKVIGLLPATFGAALGIYLALFPSLWRISALLIAAVFLLALLQVTKIMFSSAPVLWGWILEGWILFLPIATGLFASLMLWLTTMAKPDLLLPIATLSGDQRKDVIKYAVGAMTALLAAFVAGDPAKGENPFWPSYQFKRLAAPMAPDDSRGDEDFWYAAVSERTLNNEHWGWGFAARRFRAKILDR